MNYSTPNAPAAKSSCGYIAQDLPAVEPFIYCPDSLIPSDRTVISGEQRGKA